LREHGDKVPESDKSAIEADIQALKEVADSEDAKAIGEKLAVLSRSSMKLGEAIYKASQEEEAAPAEAGDSDEGSTEKAGEEDEGTVVDADFEEVDEDKKGDSA
jgi:molecular chaperone DnaK